MIAKHGNSFVGNNRYAEFSEMMQLYLESQKELISKY